MPPPVKPVQAPIPFVPDQASGLDVLRGASPAAINVIIDANGTVSRRPGIATTSIGPSGGLVDANGTPVKVQALHSTSQGRNYAVTGNELPGLLDVQELTEGNAANYGSFLGKTHPIITETEAMLVIAQSLDPEKVLFDTNEVDALEGSPPSGSHVITNSSRLLLNDAISDRTRVFYSAPALGTSITGHETWNDGITSGSFVAEGRVDPVVAITENSNEVWVFGTTSLQTFQTDATLVYVSQATMEYGCATPFGIIKSDQMFAWLDDKRRFIRSDGRDAAPFSEPIQQTLQDLERVDDCFGYRVITGPIDAFVWSFPTDGRSLVYQQGGGWSTWMSYSDTLANWKPLVISAHAFVLGDNLNLVGLVDGQLGVLRNGENTDLGDRIPAYIDTGFIDRGTDNRKACISVKIAFRRGNTPAVISAGEVVDFDPDCHVTGAGGPDDVSTAEEPFATLQYRDAEGAWRTPFRISLGVSGDRQIVTDLRSMGVYRRRQWRLSFHGTSDFVLAGALEEYLVLDN